MGIVVSQSFKNIISTYLGFAIGGINALFLYTNFLSDAYYGMVVYMFSLANIIMPIMTFGVHNTLIKFYSSFKTRISLNSFLTLMLFLPILIIIPVVLITYFSYASIGELLSNRNPIIKDYLWQTILIAIALAYFEVFFAWAKVQMKTVFGNFMKEVFHRICIMGLLILLHFKILNLEQFMWGLVIIYGLRMLIMKLYAFRLKQPVIIFKKLKNSSSILKYSALIIVAASVANQLLDIDKVMLGHYISIEEIAYYSVAVFIAAVIIVPQRAMHQILMPLSAKYLNDKNFKALDDLYKRSSLNLFIVSGLIFLLIILNINQLYEMLSKDYSSGLLVVIMISIVKLYDAFLGSNNAILFNSDYYRIVLALGVALILVMIGLNIVFIPLWGINGAALATFISIFLYNSIKLYVVYRRFKISPFTINTIKIGGFILLILGVFYFWDFPFNPIVNILLKSIIITLLYVYVVYKFKFSEDINVLMKRFNF